MPVRPSVASGVLVASVASLVACAGCSANGDQSQEAYQACLKAETRALEQQRAGVVAAPPQGPFSAELLRTDPVKITDILRRDLKNAMRAQLESQRAQQIASLRCESLRPDPETTYADSGRAAAMPPSGSADSAGSATSGGAGGTGGATQVSTTNNQVAGVDEADFVKNDSTYLYVANGSRFRIVQAWPAETAHEIANVAVSGTAKKLFVFGDRALVYSSLPKPSTSTTYGNRFASSMAGYGTGECTYGYSGCVPAGDGTETDLTVFDITNRAAPVQIRKIHTSSSLVAARRVGTVVHTVLAKSSPFATFGWNGSPNLPPKPTESDVARGYDELIARNETQIDGLSAPDVLPTVEDSEGPPPDGDVLESAMPDGSAITSVLSLDLGQSALKMASVVSAPGWVYAAQDALYMAVPHRRMNGWGWFEGRADNELTTVHAFAIGTLPHETSYVGSGVVKGHVLNQFSMDQHEGRLRVATSTGHLPDPETHSTLSVLEQVGGRLAVVGQLDGIAPSEDIRSVRFDGTRGYVVTFKKTDPLFVFDLTDPAAPKTLGELKIPGFSTYMHMMDATHLLTIGYDAADQETFAFFTGVLLQIFDVANPADPRLVHRHVIGTRGSSSEALTNHLAFNYFAPKNLLALPMTVCEGGDATNGVYGTTMTFSGLMVFDTTVASGFSLKGQVAHPNTGSTDTASYYDSTGCTTWWTNATSEVQRSIVMDDFVFSISSRRIKVNHLADLATDLGEIGIE